MKSRSLALCSLFLGGVLGVVVGCSSADATSSEPSTAAATATNAAEPVLDGHYVATGAGDFTDITCRESDASYVMWKSACDPATSSCFEVGTFALGADDTTLTLKDDATGTSTTLAFKSLQAAPSTLTTDSLRPEALSTDAGALTHTGGALVTTVQNAQIGKQTVKLVATGAKLVNSSNDNCTLSLPISGDPSTFYTQAKKAIAAKGGKLSGSAMSGSFSVPGPLGSVDGTYSVTDANVQMKVSPDSLGFVQTCERVYDALKSALGS